MTYPQALRDHLAECMTAELGEIQILAHKKPSAHDGLPLHVHKDAPAYGWPWPQEESPAPQTKD